MAKSKRFRTNKPARPDENTKDRIFGIHAVRAVLENPKRQILRLFATPNALERLGHTVTERSISVKSITPPKLTGMLGSDTTHQGVMVEAEPLQAPALDDVLSAESTGPIIVLDQVTDPHNVGAILRSASAFGAAALVMTRRNSPPLDGTVAKVASGATEHVPTILVANLARALDEIGSFGVTRIGLDGAADAPLETAPYAGAVALVLGAEHKGLRRLTAENCDLLCRISTDGVIASLNVSNAAAVALHTLHMRATQ